MQSNKLSRSVIGDQVLYIPGYILDSATRRGLDLLNYIDSFLTINVNFGSKLDLIYRSFENSLSRQDLLDLTTVDYIMGKYLIPEDSDRVIYNNSERMMLKFKFDPTEVKYNIEPVLSVLKYEGNDTPKIDEVLVSRPLNNLLCVVLRNGFTNIIQNRHDLLTRSCAGYILDQLVEYFGEGAAESSGFLNVYLSNCEKLFKKNDNIKNYIS